MRRLDAAVRLAHGAGLDGRERVAAVGPGLAAPPAGAALVAAVRVGLPDLDQPVGHGLAGAVEHQALDADAPPGRPLDEQGLRDEPELEERPDRLGGRAREPHAFSVGVAAAPPSTTSKR